MLQGGERETSFSELEVQSVSLTCMEYLLSYTYQNFAKLLILNSVVSVSVVYLFSFA